MQERVITDDKSLMEAISRAFQGPDDANLTIKFFIHESQTFESYNNIGQEPSFLKKREVEKA